MTRERVLVTGGTGVMGSRLVKRLAREGHEVRVLSVPGDPCRQRLADVPHDLCEGDVLNARALTRACADRTLVYHLAAVILSPDVSVFDRVNRGGTEAVVRAAAAAGVRHLVYVSSASVVYPRRTPYAEAKLQGEAIVKAERAFAHTIARPTLVYDETGGQEFRLFLDYLRRWPVVPFVGDGQARKRPIFSEDIVDALAKMAGNARSYGKTYNISGSEAVSIAELARLMLAHAGGGPKPFLHVPVPLCRAAAAVLARVLRDPPLNVYTIASQINDADLDPSEAMRDLDWHPIGVREGLQRCFATPASFQLAESKS